MSDTVISINEISKCYLVGHSIAKNESYNVLRDVIVRNTRNIIRKTRDMLLGRPIVQGDEIEEFWALNDVSFEVKQGDKIGIIGRNGAGKSTLLKILSRITEPTRGRIKIKGRVASLLEVGTGFHPELTGRENIILNGTILGLNRCEIKSKLDEIVAFAEIEKFIDTPVKRYSSGMYVRLAFSVAAHVEPDIMIIDEVLSVGDSRFQQKCLGKVGELGKIGRTILFVSHNLGVINSLCNKCIMLERGKLAMSGKSSEVIDHYLNGINDNKGEVLFNVLANNLCSIIRLAIIDENTGKIVNTLPFQGAFIVEIDIYANRYIDVVVGIGVTSSSGDVMTTLHSVEIGDDNSESLYFSLIPGNNRIQVCITNNIFRPGKYHLGVSVFSRKLHQNFDTKDDAITFSISDHGLHRYFNSEQKGLVFLTGSRWEYLR